MQKTLTPAERLIVAADFELPSESGYPYEWAERKVLGLADTLKGTGVHFKVNSDLRAYGYRLISKIKERGLRVFADLKLEDIPNTLKRDARFLYGEQPELLTVMCSAGVAGMKALREALPLTEVLGVTVLTSLNEDDTSRMFSGSIEQCVLRFANQAAKAEIGGIICSPAEVEILDEDYGDILTFNTPNIRPSWAQVQGDDQNPKRARTPAEAIKAGATRIVVGRPIIEAKDPREVVMRMIEEIASACG